jgi:DNA repair exonuclease SbcCD ATPase subunit
MHLSLISLHISNFKGIESLDLQLDGQNVSIFGANAAGKTSVADSVHWCLFGEDSRGSVGFEVKPLGQAGKQKHGLCPTVELCLSMDQRNIRLKRVLKEVWTKKRGRQEKELTGHKTEFYIDEAPMKKGEYEDSIEGIINKDLFKLLTSATYFNQKLDWKKRRQVLLDLFGDVSVEEVIEHNPELSKVPEILGSRTIEKHRELISKKKKEIAQKKDQLPARIDELYRSIPAERPPREIFQQRIKELECKIEAAKASNGKADLYRQKSELEAELSRLQHEDEQALRKRTQAIQDSIDQLTRERKDSAYELQSAQSKIKEIEQSRDRWTEQIEKLRAEYRELAAQEASVDGTCPTCGQELPEDQVQTAKDKFNQDKAARLKEINAEGKRIKGDVDQATQKIEELSVKTDKLDSKIAGLDQQIEAKQQELELTKNQPGPNTEVIALAEAEIRRINDQLSQDIGVDTSTMEQELEAERSKLAQVEAAKQSKARIEELKVEEKNLAKEYEDLESQTYLMEQFVVSKVHMLEEKINSKFEMARFKMFKENLNGGLEETCQVTFGGVPVGYGLNTGATIAVGMDIVRTLQTHYGIHCPIWIDNRESLVELPSMDCQVLSLVVDGSCPELTVETSTQYAEAING